jgi:hypothetical protein
MERPSRPNKVTVKTMIRVVVITVAALANSSRLRLLVSSKP